MTDPVDAVVVTGVYGAGKSTVVADLATALETRGIHYGALDVDWLGWFDDGRDAAAHEQVVLTNVHEVCRRYLDLGVRRLALARSVRDREALQALRAAVPAPLRVVRLDVPPALVEQRLLADPTEERRTDDLRVAREWLQAGHGVGLEDLLLPGDQPPRRTSHAIGTWLGWINDCPGAADCQGCVAAPRR